MDLSKDFWSAERTLAKALRSGFAVRDAFWIVPLHGGSLPYQPFWIWRRRPARILRHHLIIIQGIFTMPVARFRRLKAKTVEKENTRPQIWRSLSGNGIDHRRGIHKASDGGMLPANLGNCWFLAMPAFILPTKSCPHNPVPCRIPFLSQAAWQLLPAQENHG